MKVQVVEEPRAGGKKLIVQVVYKVNGKTKKQNKGKTRQTNKNLRKTHEKQINAA